MLVAPERGVRLNAPYSPSSLRKRPKTTRRALQLLKAKKKTECAAKTSKTSSSLPHGILVSVAKNVWNLGWGVMMSQLAPKDKTSGKYARPESQFRVKDFVDFPKGKKLYLFAGKTCPWAHRTLIVSEVVKKRLKTKSNNDNNEEDLQLEIIYLEPNKNTGLWMVPKEAIERIFFPDADDEQREMIIETLRDVYSYVSGTKFEGRATAPLLISASSGGTFEILCNESADIIRLFDCCSSKKDSDEESASLYPKEKRKEIDEMCAYLYENVNNGVYKVGFAQSQDVLDDEVAKLFAALDTLDSRLASSRFLLGDDALTLCDVCFYTTLIRFDAVYNHLFRCSHKRICDYTNLSRYLKALYALDEFRETTDMVAIRNQYYKSLFPLNPGGLVPPLPFSSTEAWLLSSSSPGPDDDHF